MQHGSFYSLSHVDPRYHFYNHVNSFPPHFQHHPPANVAFSQHQMVQFQAGLLSNESQARIYGENRLPTLLQTKFDYSDEGFSTAENSVSFLSSAPCDSGIAPQHTNEGRN